MRWWIWMLISVVFAFGETWYFGWNWTAQSNAERLCDHIATFLLAIGTVVLCVSMVRDMIKKEIAKATIIHERTHH